MIRLLGVLVWCYLTAPLTAQAAGGVRNLDRAIAVLAGYGPFRTAGDLGARYGNGFAVDGGVDLLPANGPWQFGLAAQFGFGNTVKEDVLSNLRTDAGFIIGTQRQPAQVALRHRQFFAGPHAGYTLALGANRRAGIHFNTAVGYFFSHIRIQEDPNQYVPPLDRAYRAGYDRLAGGPAVRQFVGYQQLATDRRLNFYVGGEVLVARGRQLRAYDIPLGGPPDASRRTDVVLGLRAGILLPVYLGEGREIFYR